MSTVREPYGIIIAGIGDRERTFSAPQSALEKSSVIRGWIEDCESIPSSLQKGNALYFPECDSEVVRAVLDYLMSTANGLIAFFDPKSVGENRDVMFYVKAYKLALCLGLDEICVVSLHKIKELTRDTQTFLEVLSATIEAKSSLVDNRNFYDWVIDYVARKSEVLKESTLFKSMIFKDQELAWRLCTLFITSIAESQVSTKAQSVPASASSPSLSPPYSGESYTRPTTGTERRRSQYAYSPPQKSPIPKHDSNRVKKPQKATTKKFGATVEDAGD